MGLILPALLCFAGGFFLAGIGLPRLARGASTLVLHISLGIGYGLALVSLLFLLSRALGGMNPLGLQSAACALLFLGYVLAQRRKETFDVFTPASSEIPHWLRHLLTVGSLTALACAIYAAILRVLAHPQGDGWDAFAIWNLHARFLFFNGANWHEGFSALIPWSHPDYPLLLPGAIANFWVFLGHDSPVVPAALSLLFTFSTAGVLFAALDLLRGRTAAALAITALLSTPSFIEIGTSQYADVPLSYFFLSTAALLCIAEERSWINGRVPTATLTLAGVTASFALWTKNEGLLFFCAIVAARFFLTLRKTLQSTQESDAPLRFVPFILGALPILILVAYFKHLIAPPSELFSNSPSTIHKLLTPARYWAVTQWFVKEFFRFGHWLAIPGSLLLVLSYVGIGKSISEKAGLQLRVLRLALLLTMAGYVVIYLITPYEIYWHLRFSLNRLFLQLWPSTIFLFFMYLFRSRAWHIEVS